MQNGPYNQRSICYTPDGIVLIGGQGGLDIINPEQMGAGRIKETPLFSGLKVFDREVEPSREFDGRVILDEALDVCRQLVLRYSENQFTIQLSSSSGEIHNRSRFVYKLMGFNEEWVRTEEVNPNITYMSLPAGSYTLCVRMLNDDGTMGDIESQLEITIRPPFYRTWIAYIIYLLIFLSFVWWWRKNFIRRQDRHMETETLRRETEKQQWMNKMHMEMMKDKEPVVQEEIHLEKKERNIVEFVRDICDTFKSPENKRVKTFFNSTTEEVIMPFDARQLGEMLRLLMTNSAHFSPHDCIMQISLFATTPGEVKILVADNGIGIRDEFKPHVFEPMLVEGEGVGLDRVKAVIDAHGGTISVADNPGGGTVFTITLPTGENEEIADAVLMDEE